MDSTHNTIIRLCIACLVVCCAHQATFAQGLDLGSPSAPKPGDGRYTLTLAQQLADRADALTNEHGDERRHRQLRARAAVRTMAVELLRSGEGAGASGSQAVLLGLTIAANIDQFDDVLTDKLVRIDDSTLELIAASSPRPGAFDAIVTDPRQLDGAVAIMLAPLTEATLDESVTIGGWWLTRNSRSQDSTQNALSSSNDPTSAIDQWSKDGHVDAPLEHQLRAFGAIRDIVKPLPGALYRWRTAWNDLGTLVTASDAIQRRFGDDTAAHVHEIALLVASTLSEHPPASAQSTRARDMLAGTAWAIRTWRSLDSALSNASKRTLREPMRSMIQSITIDDTPARTGDVALRADVTATLDEVVALLVTPMTLPDEDRLVRQLKPARRTFSKELGASTDQLARHIPDVLTGKTTLSTPGLLASMQVQREGIASIRLLAAASDTLAASVGDPGAGLRAVAPAWSGPAHRALELSKDFDKREGSDEARKQFRQLTLDLSRFGLLPGEDALNQESAALGTAWAALTNKRHLELGVAIPDARRKWTDKARLGAGDKAAEAEALRLDALTETMDILTDAIRVASTISWSNDRTNSDRAHRSASRQLWVQHWAGWELSDDALWTLLDELEPELVECVTLALDADPFDAIDRAKEIRQQHAVVLLAGALDSVSALGIGRVVPDIDPSASSSYPVSIRPIIELSFGSPGPNAWLVGHRADIAAACRYAQEYTHEQSAGSTADRMRQHANDRAFIVLERLRASRRPEG